MNKPLITVTMSSFNHEAYVEQAILSIINQSYGFNNIQLIVTDDASIDDTAKIVERLSIKNSFIFIRNTENKGVVFNKNNMVKQAVGKYIAGCASDDYWDLTKLEKQVNQLESLGNEYAVCHSSAILINERNEVIGNQDIAKKHNGDIFPDIIKFNFIVSPSVLIKKEVYDTIGFHDPNIISEDRDFWIRAAQKYKFRYINERLVVRRIHGENLSLNYTKMYNATKAIYEKYEHFYKLYNLDGYYHLSQFGKAIYFKNNLWKEHLMKSWKISIKSIEFYKIIIRKMINLYKNKN